MGVTVVAVVLAGGTGTRLYPASRPDRPKQLLALGSESSLLTRTVDRAGFADQRYVLTRPSLADAVREHASGAAVLTEPEPRDTGPALVYAAHRVREQVGDCVLVCLPSDHQVSGDFAPTMERAAAVAADTGRLVTLGVEPSRPATGYGYIEPGADRGEYREVARFVEKPDGEAAQQYVEAGWLWNAGMFAWTPDALLGAARDSPLAPLVEALDAGEPAAGFEAVEAVSVDNAVLERADDVAVVPADFAWDDLGSWDAVGRVLEADADGNAHLGETLAVDAADCVLAAGEDSHVSAVGVEGLAVASYDGRTLVVPREDAERVREVVRRLESSGDSRGSKH
ncbi:MAG: sugar phosphate nucleotidyltransferase [Haloarculaceae archaeon]